jgi:hypothetical protein
LTNRWQWVQSSKVLEEVTPRTQTVKSISLLLVWYSRYLLCVSIQVSEPYSNLLYQTLPHSIPRSMRNRANRVRKIAGFYVIIFYFIVNITPFSPIFPRLPLVLPKKWWFFDICSRPFYFSVAPSEKNGDFKISVPEMF